MLSHYHHDWNRVELVVVDPGWGIWLIITWPVHSHHAFYECGIHRNCIWVSTQPNQLDFQLRITRNTTFTCHTYIAIHTVTHIITHMMTHTATHTRRHNDTPHHTFIWGTYTLVPSWSLVWAVHMTFSQQVAPSDGTINSDACMSTDLSGCNHLLWSDKIFSAHYQWENSGKHSKEDKYLNISVLIYYEYIQPVILDCVLKLEHL